MDVPGGSLTFFGVFLVGLGLNLTPCVYPMLTITVSLFGGRKESRVSVRFFHALIYVMGMATMYSALGVLAALTGSFFGLLLQNPFVLAAITAVLVLMALSMLGVYNFQLPSWLTSGVGSRQSGFIGLYLSGLLAGIVAAPCIGPPVIALLTLVGTRGEPAYAFWTFFVMSLGLGAPYLVLGTFSGLLRRLPKSGVWLVWVERVFGVGLLILAFYFGILAFNPFLLKWLPSIALIFSGVYLGFIESSGDQTQLFRRIKRTVGVAAVIAGVLTPFSMPTKSVAWTAYAPEKLQAAQTAGKPVIMDFYADWCIPCHELDRFTYSDDRVIDALNRFERIKVDLTRQDAPELEAVVEKFSIVGVPTIVFLNSEGNEVEEVRAAGFISADELLTIARSPKLRNRSAAA